MLLALVLTAGFMVAEVIGGLLSGSLALIADAGHMLTDAAALGLAWAGFYFGKRASNATKTFGYMRLEVLAGFVNAVTLFALVAWIAWEAIDRLLAPAPVLAGPMLVVAILGLAVNIAVFLILRGADTEHVNIKGAMLHVMGDLLGSVAAIVAAIAIYFTGWTPIDPILSVLILLLILRSAWALLKNSLHILLEGAPADIDIERAAHASDGHSRGRHQCRSCPRLVDHVGNAIGDARGRHRTRRRPASRDAGDQARTGPDVRDRPQHRRDRLG